MPSKRTRSISLANPSRRWALAAPSLIALFAMGHSPTANAAKSGLETRKPSIADFDRIWVNVPADFKIEPADSASISLTAEPKVLDAIRVTSANGELRIETSGSFKTQKSVTITIGARSVSALSSSGSSDVTITGAYAPSLELLAHDASSVTLDKLNLVRLTTDLSGSSEIQASGVVSELSLAASDASSFEGSSLTTETAKIEVSGASEASLEVKKALVVKIKDAASVYYAGEPTIEQSVSFAGTLEPQ